MNDRTGRRTGFLAGVVLLFGAAGAAQAADAGAAAREILRATGVKGGLVVHLGCGDGRLTAALRANDSFVVQGLDRDAEHIAAAREHIRSLGLYGPVSAERLVGPALPYVDNLVNLLVVEDASGIDRAELLRVLCPQGVAYVRQGGGWTKTVKPRPGGIDDWTHDLHDPTNNAVSRDTVVGPPRHFQWLGGPKYGRHHDHMSSASAMVAAGGRVFAIFDHGSPMSIQLPSRWMLVARDAFNGTVLWRREIPQWYTQMFRLKSGPAQLPRRLVAVGEKVYVTLGLEAPVSVLDAATGRTLAELKATARAEEVLVADGVVYAVVNDRPFRQPASPRALDYTFHEGPRRIVAVRAEDGSVLWNVSTPGVLPCTLTVGAARVLYAGPQRVVCLDRRTGREQWRSEPLERRKVIPTFFGPTLVAAGDVVLYSGGSIRPDDRNRGGGVNTMYALSAETGRTLWTAEHPPSGYKSPEDIFVIDGVVWTPTTTVGSLSGETIGRDLKTGRVVKRFLPDVETHWFHHRCYRAKATEKYLLTSRTGIEFVDPRSGHWTCNHWVRGACLYGTMPAYGMVFNPPHPCACYLESKLYGFHALAPASPARAVPKDIPRAGRLEKGPAYSRVDKARSQPGPQDWPTLRHDPARSGRTETAVPAEVKPAWRTKLGGRLSSVVVAGGVLLVAAIDAHTVHALDARTGRPLWQFTAGGRVDSPPTVWRGRALFGSADGYVYCLRAADGALCWRFRAAPLDRRMGAFNQVESVWPVHGSVLIRPAGSSRSGKDELWCVAGRSMFLDGGLRLLRLDAATGGLIAERILDERDPASGENLQARLKGLNMPVALPDVLSFDGKYVYMRSQRFDAAGVREEIEIPTLDPAAAGPGAHLFCPTGLLDDVWWHRSYWVFGRVWKSGAGGYYLAGRVAPAGRPMVVGDGKVYGFARKPEYYRWTTPMEYQLFASAKQPQRLGAAARRGQAAPARGPGAKKQPPARKAPGAKAPGNRAAPAGGKAARPGQKRRRAGLAAKPAGRIATDWTRDVPVLARGMVLAKETLFIAGPPDVVDEVRSLNTFDQPGTQKLLARQAAALDGAEGGLLWAVSAADGTPVARHKLDVVCVHDGLIAAGGKLYMATVDGQVVCLGGK